ncbi:YdcF family protein [Paenibacillus sp. IB182496]|uniref:YdcF family protein n=1 Tax=Paenibacillus sabuli TaxID=2772509 RepID=A0A927GTU3_9BACL|nr:YdcF family protein [Paenibacillus sabuli]MBD2847983.1 YdcF family protein [Paenibacillus sabuli]
MRPAPPPRSRQSGTPAHNRKAGPSRNDRKPAPPRARKVPGRRKRTTKKSRSTGLARSRLLPFLLRLALWAGAAGIFWMAYALWQINDFREPRLLEPADVGIVLGASLRNDEPSPGLRERLDRALALYEAGKVRRLIVSGGLDSNGATITEAEGMRRHLVARGVPDEAVLVEPQARSTYENLLYSRALMIERGWTSVIVITHDFHAARALEIAQVVGIEEVQATGVKSRALSHARSELREVLAYTKWTLDRLLLKVGWRLPELPLGL